MISSLNNSLYASKTGRVYFVIININVHFFDISVFSYSNIEELVFALRSKQIDSIVLDHFTVLDRKDLFNGTWYKFSDVVGQSFSYGLILNGNASNLDRQFREYISANITKIMALVGGVDEIVVSGDNKTEPEEVSILHHFYDQKEVIH